MGPPISKAQADTIVDRAQVVTYSRQCQALSILEGRTARSRWYEAEDYLSVIYNAYLTLNLDLFNTLAVCKPKFAFYKTARYALHQGDKPAPRLTAR